MSIKEKESVMSIHVRSEYLQNEHEMQDKPCDKVDGENSFEAPNHKLSLKFRCSDTPSQQRKLCKSFWKATNQHPELDRIIARGWSERDKTSIVKPPKKETPPLSHCDDLQEFLDHSVDKLVLWGFKNLDKECSTESKLDHSSTKLFEELQDFDSRVKTEISIPPKTPRS